MFKIEKLSDSNYHVWKQKVELVLAFRELEDHIVESRPPADQAASVAWHKNDAKAKAIIGLTLSDEHLEHVRELESAVEMWEAIKNLFQRKTLLNRLTARRRFYSVKMLSNEKVIVYISRVRQLASDLKAMDVLVSDQEIAMTVLSGLPSKYEHLIVAIDTVADDEKLTTEFVKSRLLQEEQRLSDRTPSSSQSVDSALIMHTCCGVSTPSNERHVCVCSHCGKKGHPESRCWKKHPHLRPNHNKQKGLVVDSGTKDVPPDDTNDNVVCLLTGASTTNTSRACQATWIIDSGATSHICHDKNLFSTFQSVKPFDISIGDKSGVRAVGRGSVDVVLLVSGKSKKCTISDVVYAPSMGYNMLSVRVMNRTGKKTVFEEDYCYTVKDGQVLAEGEIRNGLYCLKTSSAGADSSSSVSLVADLNLWHQRMAHVHVDGIRDMVRKGIVEGVNVDLKKDLVRCDACVYGKSTRAPIPSKGGARASNVLDLVHSDVCGPFPVPSHGNSRYFLSFVDDRSRFAWVYPIQSKSDVFETFKRWLAMVENSESNKQKVPKSPRRLKVLQSDNGGEYLSKQMIGFLKDRGIQHRLTTPYNPHQNGVAERINRTLCDLIRSMLHQKKMPKEFWAEALSVATHVRNRVTTRGLGSDTTPFQVLYNRKPNMSYLRVFGSRCWYNLRKPDIDKLDPRAREALMIGYARGIRGYKLWDIADQKVVVSRDVKFDEDGNNALTDTAKPPENDVESDSLVDNGSSSPSSEDGDSSDHPDDVPEVVDSAPDVVIDDPDDVDYVPDSTDTAAEDMPPELEVTLQQIPVEPRRSTRQKRAPGHWWSAAVALISNASSADPTTFMEAVSGSSAQEWMKSMTAEHESLVENECWELVPRPSNTNVVSCKWVYKTKEEQTSEGTLGVRLKSRLVARGFSQIEGIDYSETYAPVVKFTSVRVLLAIVASMDLLLHQMDVKTAFLNGDLKETVYMEQPQGFEQGDPSKVVCRLKKAIYGLKQAPRQWYAKIDEFFMTTLGMTRNPADDCIYVRREGGHLLIIALYVDDLLIACSDESMLSKTKNDLSERFKMKDLGESRIILGMDITRDRSARTLSVCQSRYAQKVIERFGLGSARGQSTPMDPTIDLGLSDTAITEPYREAIGSLMYLMVGTRPDLAYCIGTLAKYVESPNQTHWGAVKRVIRYVIHTKEYGLVYSGATLQAPEVYVDADWAGDHETRKSMSGFVAMMSGAAVAWCARQQEVVAMSSAESEYISMCAGVKETVWLRRLISGLEIVPNSESATVMHVDNQAAIALANNTAVNRRNKHIDVRYHYTRQAVHDNVIELQYCPTNLMIADMLTKPLGRVKLEGFVKDCGISKCESAKGQTPRGGM